MGGTAPLLAGRRGDFPAVVDLELDLMDFFLVVGLDILINI